MNVLIFYVYKLDEFIQSIKLFDFDKILFAVFLRKNELIYKIIANSGTVQ